MTQQDHLVIATRESPLALWQAKYVQSCLKEKFPELDVQLLGLTTKGDKILDVTLSKIGGKGLFVKELEAAMLEGKAQIAVHSLKAVSYTHLVTDCLQKVFFVVRGGFRKRLLRPV